MARTMPATLVLVAALLLAAIPAGAVTLDRGFTSAAPDTNVEAIAVQDDGRVVIGGRFSFVGGASRSFIARLEPDGALDTTFAPALPARVKVLAIQPGRGVLVGYGAGPSWIARVTFDGVVDPSFPACFLNGMVVGMVVQRDGKILVAGQFHTVGTVSREGIARLKPDGALDEGFDAHADDLVNALALQPDGKILAGGRFETIGGASRGRLARLNPDGSADTSFANPAADNEVSALGLQADGRLVVSGYFSSIGGGARERLARLNADGTLDGGFTTGLSGPSEQIAIQADGRILLAGPFGLVGGVRRLTFARLLRDGSLDMSFDPNADCSVIALALQRDGMILVGGCFGEIGGGAADYVARLHPDGSLDGPFAPAAYNTVYAAAIQPDGKIVLGGAFLKIDGVARSLLARLNANGTLDPTFNPGVSGGLGFVTAVAVQADGRIVFGGSFDTVAGAARSNLARVNADGTLDAGFSPDPNGQVNTIAVQPNGRILVGGEFTQIGGFDRGRVARLYAGGLLDITFLNPSADDAVMAIALQPDGKVLVGGNFTHIRGEARDRIARLNSGGTLDASFTAAANDYVYALAVRPDGKIFVGGAFTAMSGRNRLARLNANGTVDGSFFFSANERVFTMALQTDGKLLVGGKFTTVAGQPRTYLARLVADTDPAPSHPPLDDGFNVAADSWVYSLAAQSDGRIIVGGAFYNMGGEERPRIARLAGAGTAVADLAVASDGSSALWRREGAGPEVDWATLEYSTDGLDWSSRGSAARVAETWATGWMFTDLSLPDRQAFFLRARGFYSNGTVGSIAESLRLFYRAPVGPVMVTHPASATVAAGASVSFTALAAGYPTPSVKWQVNTGAAWTDVAGAITARYDHVAQASESGWRYRAVFTSSAGTAVSDPATLTVVVPVELLGFSVE